MKDKRTNVGYGKSMASSGGSGGMRGGGRPSAYKAGKAGIKASGVATTFAVGKEVKDRASAKRKGSVSNALKYEEKKSAMQRKYTKGVPKQTAKGYKRRPPTPGGRSF